MTMEEVLIKETQYLFHQPNNQFTYIMIYYAWVGGFYYFQYILKINFKSFNILQ